MELEFIIVKYLDMAKLKKNNEDIITEFNGYLSNSNFKFKNRNSMLDLVKRKTIECQQIQKNLEELSNSFRNALFKYTSTDLNGLSDFLTIMLEEKEEDLLTTEAYLELNGRDILFRDVKHLALNIIRPTVIPIEYVNVAHKRRNIMVEQEVLSLFISYIDDYKKGSPSL